MTTRFYFRLVKIQFHIRGLNVHAASRDRFQRSIEGMQRLIPIAAAAVVLENERESAPAFRVFALLAVPGPDIHAEARDHTLEAAWRKVAAALRKQIERRKYQQEGRKRQGGNARNMTRGLVKVCNGVFRPTYSAVH